MFYTYVLKSLKTSTRYIGSTDNLKRRLQEHNNRIGGDYTKKHAPFEIIFYEAYTNYADAKKSEKFYKTGYGREILNGKLENYLKSIN